MDALLHLFVRDAEDDAFDLEREVTAFASQTGWDATLAELMLFLGRPGKSSGTRLLRCCTGPLAIDDRSHVFR
jgi:hypothetical protein